MLAAYSRQMEPIVRDGAEELLQTYTEDGGINYLAAAALLPSRSAIDAACAECRFMKMNTLEKAFNALRDLTPEITLPEPLRVRAELPIRRMLELSR